jgi:hypothetical protein
MTALLPDWELMMTALVDVGSNGTAVSWSCYVLGRTDLLQVGYSFAGVCCRQLLS